MLNSYPLILQEPWQLPEHLMQRRGGELAPSLRAALAYAGSLTRHLESHWGGQVTVRLENQRLVQGEEVDQLLANSGEPWQALALPKARQGVLLRDAWLAVGGVDRIYAHSRVVLAGLSPEMQRAIQLGAEPLGNLFLQSEAILSREGLRLALAQIPDLSQHRHQPPNTLYWCRHSLLRVDDGVRAGILEIFL